MVRQLSAHGYLLQLAHLSVRQSIFFGICDLGNSGTINARSGYSVSGNVDLRGLCLSDRPSAVSYMTTAPITLNIYLENRSGR